MVKYENGLPDWVTTSLWILAFVVGGMIIAAECSADCGDDLIDRMVDTTHEGSEGFFLLTADMECLLLRLERVPRLESYIALLDERIELSDQRHDRMIHASKMASEIILNYETALSDAMQSLVDLDAWWSSPWLWFPVGIVLGASAVIAGGLLL